MILKKALPLLPWPPFDVSVGLCVCASKGQVLIFITALPVSFSALATQLDRKLLVLCVTVRCPGIGAHARQR